MDRIPSLPRTGVTITRPFNAHIRTHNPHTYTHIDVRIAVVAGGPCPCGGTHVKSTRELGAVEVTRIKVTAKKRVVKVSYKISAGGGDGHGCGGGDGAEGRRE
jgi:kynurenine formamidase